MTWKYDILPSRWDVIRYQDAYNFDVRTKVYGGVFFADLRPYILRWRRVDLDASRQPQFVHDRATLELDVGALSLEQYLEVKYPDSLLPFYDQRRDGNDEPQSAHLSTQALCLGYAPFPNPLRRVELRLADALTETEGIYEYEETGTRWRVNTFQHTITRLD